MNAPFTPFEQVFAFLRMLTNLPDALQKSTEEWMEETRKNLAVWEQQFAEGTAEYEKTEKEAFGVLTRQLRLLNHEQSRSQLLNCRRHFIVTTL